jgi:hypothetical protein
MTGRDKGHLVLPVGEHRIDVGLVTVAVDYVYGTLADVRAYLEMALRSNLPLYSNTAVFIERSAAFPLIRYWGSESS